MGMIYDNLLVIYNGGQKSSSAVSDTKIQKVDNFVGEKEGI